MFKPRKAQSTLEFMVLVVILIGAFIAIGDYFKRAVQGRWKAAVDDLGDQYDPRFTNSDFTTSISSNTVTTITSVPDTGGIWTMREDITNTVETRTGFSTVGSTPVNGSP